MADSPPQRRLDDGVIHVGHAGQRSRVVGHAAHPSQADAFDLMPAHDTYRIREIVDAACITFQCGLGLNVKAFTRTGFEFLIVAEPGNRFDRFVERVAEKPGI